MNWILIGVVVLLAQKQNYASIYGMANPIPHTGPSHNINPYIRHWEAANFDRDALHVAHQQHIEKIHRRRKREINSSDYGQANLIKLNFFAHDREFRLVLRQDPMSVFTKDVEIENTEGPVDYDISRVYTGSLEDDENSHVHAILTSENLLDGTISTNTEQYYVEPSHRYSDKLPKAGIHSIVYKLSDVKMEKSVSSVSPSKTTTSSSSPSVVVSSSSSSTTMNPVDAMMMKDIANEEHCASEKLRKKLLQNDMKRRQTSEYNNHNEMDRIYENLMNQKQEYEQINVKAMRNDDTDISRNNRKNDTDNRKNKNTNNNNRSFHQISLNDVSMSHNRRKRWLPDELSDNQNPPLPLDLEVPYNDDMSFFDRNSNKGDTNRNNPVSDGTGSTTSNHPFDRSEVDYVTRTRNNFNINRNSNSNNNNNNSPFESDLNRRGITGNIIFSKSNRNRNILLNEYNLNNSDHTMMTTVNSRSHLTNTRHNNNILVNNFNSTLNTRFNNFFNHNDNIGMNNGILFNNGGISGIGGSTSRPSHKTHVEIITKNGATKKPNIIVNNYNPDVILTSQNFNSHLNLNLNTNSARSSYDRKSTCMLYLQADHTFFQKMGTDETSIEAITRHVQRANAIYRNTDFNGDGKPDNITFMIKRIKVHNANALKDPTYRFPGNYGVEKFLELFSEEDYDAFCLAYMFTYRDFEMGTLGLAWTGDLKNAGGVCEKNGHYRGSLKSLNTGIVTLLNYGKHVPPAVSHVTLAHEIGHNFGSPHDPEQCTPGGEDGNYIMFARATSGDKRNNNKFSPCSLKSIEPVLNAKARSAKGCFTEPQQSICGNGVVEPGEQCDCGWEEDCKDSCCFPMSRHPRPDERPCTLTPRAMCSPSQGPCCTVDCSLKFGDKCRDDNGCRDPSFCDGRMPQCPPSVNKPNKTICNKEFVCYMGECTGSICLAYGLESCQCLPGPNDPKTKSCELCCKQPGEGNICKSSFEWNEPPYDVPDMFAKPGTPCNDYNGYCDVFQKCREVDPSGPLATLRKLLLSEESIASFKKWFHTNWYTVALAATGVVVLLIVAMKLLGKRSSNKLKSVTIIHSATTETVRLPEDNNGVIVHTAIRTKVPFKKKVRGERPNKIKIANKKSALLTTTNVPSNVISNGVVGGSGQVIAAVTKNSSSSKLPKQQRSCDVPKKSVRKKNRVSAPVNVVEEQQQNKLNELKKNKKNKKHKEIIDYSSNAGSHTNTFGKVQKWLLESPIVIQPLSHIEHSSKVQKVMSKSQSTPERLVQKSPKKSKSVGNLSNEKVKLQVVYKPPFKFSLKLSKNSAVKTHVIGGALGRSKRKPRSADKKGRIGVTPLTNSSNNKFIGEKGRRTALLFRSLDDDCKKLTVNNTEPNYETLNPKANDNRYYENVNFTSNTTNLVSKDEQLLEPQQQQDQLINEQQQQQKFKNGDDPEVPMPSSSKSATFRVNRSSSNNNIERQSAQMNNKSQQPNISYSRSNSVTNNPFNARPSSSSIRKISDNSMNLSRNFGSTQNLLPTSSSSSSQNHFSKSKKRNSLNLKSSDVMQNDFNRSNFASKRSNSNLNLLKRENSSSNLKCSNDLQPHAIIPIPIATRNSGLGGVGGIGGGLASTTNSSNNLKLSSSSSLSRSSISNIPRASLCNATQLGPAFARQTSLNVKIPPPPAPLPAATPYNSNNSNPSNNKINHSSNQLTNNTNFNSNLNNVRPHTASCVETGRQFEWPILPVITTAAAASSSSSSGIAHTTNSGNGNGSVDHQQQSNNKHNTKIMKKNIDNEPLPSDLEVMVSDVEHLVS